MSKEQATSLRTQIDDKVIDARNEVIVQATNAFLLGRQVVLTGVGLTFLGIDQVQALMEQAVKRGAVAESDVQKTADTLRRQLAEGTTSSISSRLAALLNRVPGVSIDYKGPAATASAGQDAQPPANEQDQRGSQ